MKTFPFTEKQLEKFRNELDQADGFLNLMYMKKAITKKMGMQYISLYNDIEKYKTKFLIGEYEPLREMYDTEMPYIFWSAMHEMLLQVEKAQA